MKTVYTLLLVLATANFASSQAQRVVGSSGTYTAGASYTMQWTIGEAITVLATGTNYTAAQGFHQDSIYVLGIESFEIQISDILVYPNPARDQVTVDIQEDATIYIYDAQGKIVDTKSIFTSNTTIDVSNLSRGTYTMMFEVNGTISKRSKIVIL